MTFHRPAQFLQLALLLIISGVSVPGWAATPRALPEGKLPDDVRLQPLKDLDGYFPFTVPSSRNAWNERAEFVRRRILVSQGLWPMPEKTPLNAVIHGKMDMGDYTIEKVFFESVPGFFVTGNLYRPKGGSGRMPGVLCPHGHWNNGRFMDAGENEVKQEIVQGAERFEDGGRSPLQSRCVQLARMGCVVFHYDMIGYADSVQIPQSLSHGFARQRPEMNTTENWGLFSPQAEAHLQSVMGLQTWDSIRSLDFLLTLPDVDPDRIACTGASGGGTQTFILSAIDPRVKVAFPAVMVSTAMQGGCTCENSSLLRVDTGNVEIAALFAPKPLGMTCANDWTKEMSTKGYPELKQLFTMLGSPDNVSLKRGEQFGHNYNYVSRAAMYSWMNKHLQLGLKEPIVEQGYRRLTKAELTVWDQDHPQPSGGEEFERKLLARLQADTDKQLAAIQNDETKFREVIGGGIDVLIGRNLASAGDVEWDMSNKADHGEWLEMTGLLNNKTYHEAVPVVFHFPKKWKGETVIWLSGRGKASLYDANGALQPEVKNLVNGGATVVGVDLLYQGEFLADGKSLEKTSRVKNPREAAAYTFGYNHSVFAERTHDILTVIKYIQNHERPTKVLSLAGIDGAGTLAVAACAQSGDAIGRLAVDTDGFRFGKLTEIHDPNFLPGGAKYGDVPGMIALCMPKEMLLGGELGEASADIVQRHIKSRPANRMTKWVNQRNVTAEMASTWLTDLIKPSQF